MQDIKSLTLEELKREMELMGERSFRAKQLYQWMHGKLARSFEEMTNLPLSLREKCTAAYEYASLKKVRMQESATDGTRKYLFELGDGGLVESVLMKYKYGNSICISSQVGCSMGCAFCASAIGGLERSLTPSEMLDQVYAVTLDTRERISNVVVMGTGEPLDNYNNLLRFLALLTDENGLHISQRNVTVSTCGLVPGIRALADEGLQITLALSLHAADDETRRKLMPIARRYSVSEVIEACGYYFEKTGRRVTFEYALMRGINDTMEDAGKLAELLKGKNCHVNLIPVNPVEERKFIQSEGTVISAFKKRLEKNGINVTIRREMGRDIDGACGQLRKRQRALQ